MIEMTKAELVAEEIRNLNDLDSDAVVVPSYDRYALIICKVDIEQLKLPEGYFYNGAVLTNKGHTGNNGYWSFKIQKA